MSNIRTYAGFSAVLVATLIVATGGSAFAHGMGGHMGGSGPHMGSVSTTHTTKTMTNTTKIIEHHDRFRHRRFFAFGYVAPDHVCVWKRTIDGLVKICPDDWY